MRREMRRGDFIERSAAGPFVVAMGRTQILCRRFLVCKFGYADGVIACFPAVGIFKYGTCKIRAVIERIVANTGNAIRDGDVCKVQAAVERCETNAGDAVGKDKTCS